MGEAFLLIVHSGYIARLVTETKWAVVCNSSRQICQVGQCRLAPLTCHHFISVRRICARIPGNDDDYFARFLLAWGPSEKDIASLKCRISGRVSRLCSLFWKENVLIQRMIRSSMKMNNKPASRPKKWIGLPLVPVLAALSHMMSPHQQRRSRYTETSKRSGESITHGYGQIRTWLCFVPRARTLGRKMVSHGDQKTIKHLRSPSIPKAGLMPVL